MKYLSILLFFCTVSLAFAEHTEQKNQVYNQKSQLTAENINQAVQILRNPTLMSGNFRQALKNIKPGIPTASAATPFSNDDREEDDMPFIELVAKVMAKDKPSTIVLKVNDHTLHLTEGNTASQLVNRKIVNIRVDEITDSYVKIYLSPFEQVMVLQ
ncbi:MAG: hypothetical protein GQ532_01580 [Methylomarinum sp.]|nr:hypothetical protein [Methylomarinum sp.]